MSTQPASAAPRATIAELSGIVELIADAGDCVSQWFQHEPELSWEHARRWSAFCGTVAAFAFVVIYETLRSGSATPSPELCALFKAIEDRLFELYGRENHNYPMAIARLPLASERQQVCAAFDEREDTLVTMDMILGIIFPQRSGQYQMDWAAGFPSKRFGAPAEYVAMRLAADLMGISTPQSLVGHTASDLGIMTYGQALSPLSQFVSNYTLRKV